MHSNHSSQIKSQEAYKDCSILRPNGWVAQGRESSGIGKRAELEINPARDQTYNFND